MSNVVALRAHARANERAYSGDQQRDVMRSVPRSMSSVLTLTHLSVLNYVLSQSVDMGREYWLTTYKSLEEGNPQICLVGLGYSRRQLQRILAYLSKIGALTVELTGRGLKIVPTRNWKPVGLPPTNERRREKARKAAATRLANGAAKVSPASTLWKDGHGCHLRVDIHVTRKRRNRKRSIYKRRNTLYR